jgi:hypothetical protein
MPCLSQQTLRRLLALATLTLLSATLALAQSPTQATGSSTPSAPSSGVIPWTSYSLPQYTNWNRLAQLHLGGKLFVVTMAHPHLRHVCNVQSFANEQLVCKDPLGVTHTYQPQKIAALIIPGQQTNVLAYFLGFTGAGAAATWGTLVLASTCVPCAVVTGMVAGLLYIVALGSGMGADADTPDQLLYLSPGETLQAKLRD